MSLGPIRIAMQDVLAAPPPNEQEGVRAREIAEIVSPPAKISILDLCFFYGQTQALNRVALEIPEKRAAALIGPSGCGKSTLLRVLNRLYDMYPDERVTGEALLDGKSILGTEVDLSDLRCRIGMVFQGPTPFPTSIFENVAFGPRTLENLPHRSTSARVEPSLTHAALCDEVKVRLSARAESLSMGQQQRLCSARTIANPSEVILFDEPTSALDPISSQRIEALIGDLKRDFTIVIVTHNMKQARRCADKIAMLYLGQLIEAGSTTQMFDAPRQKRTQDYIGGQFG